MTFHRLPPIPDAGDRFALFAPDPQPPHPTPELRDAQTFLAKTQKALDPFDTDIWKQHTRKIAFTKNVKQAVQKKTGPELCSRGWLKMTEIAFEKDAFDIFPHPTPRPTIRSLHLCECPGAFVSALNHAVVHRFGTNKRWWWRASALNPAYEANSHSHMVRDPVLVNKTPKHWIWGLDNSGDITNCDNIDYITKEVLTQGGPVHIVTADGGVDCSESPESQESTLYPLLLAQCTAALSVLCTGGTLVVKAFSLLTTPTASLTHLLSSLFDAVVLCKPATSGQSNSERYIVCTGLREFPSDTLKALRTAVRKQTAAPCLPPASMHPPWLQSYASFATRAVHVQCGSIRRSIRLFYNFTAKEKADLEKLQDRTAKEFCDTYAKDGIPPDFRLAKDHNDAPATEATFSRYYFKLYRLRNLKRKREPETDPLPMQIPPMHLLRSSGFSPQLVESVKRRVSTTITLASQRTQRNRRGLGFASESKPAPQVHPPDFHRITISPSDPPKLSWLCFGKPPNPITNSMYASPLKMLNFQAKKPASQPPGRSLTEPLLNALLHSRVLDSFSMFQTVSCQCTPELLRALNAARGTTFRTAPAHSNLDFKLVEAQNFSETQCAARILDAGASALQSLNEGAVLVVVTDVFFTRLVASAILLLASCFNGMLIVPAPGSPTLLVCIFKQFLRTEQTAEMSRFIATCAHELDSPPRGSYLKPVSLLPHAMLIRPDFFMPIKTPVETACEMTI